MRRCGGLKGPRLTRLLDLEGNVSHPCAVGASRESAKYPPKLADRNAAVAKQLR
jgi:hypothetical protein